MVSLAHLPPAEPVREPGFPGEITLQLSAPLAAVGVVLDAGTPAARALPVDRFAVPVGHGSGSFWLTLPIGPTPSGTHRVTITATDSAGRTGQASASFDVLMSTLSYALRLLPTVGDSLRIHAMNDSGDVVGAVRASPTDPWRPVLWHDGAIVPLSLPPALAGDAVAINDVGEIAGNTSPRPDVGDPVAARWSRFDATPVVDPGSATGAGCGYCAVAGINERGTVLVAGGASGEPGLWRRDGSFAWIGQLFDTGAFIDANDVVYGHHLQPEYIDDGVRWTPERQPIPCPLPQAYSVLGQGIICRPYAGNAAGDVLAHVAAEPRPMIRLASDGQWYDLAGRLAGSVVPAVAPDGEVVALHGDTRTVLLWKEQAVRVVALPASEWTVRQVVAINAGKQILAVVQSARSGAVRPALLVPNG